MLPWNRRTKRSGDRDDLNVRVRADLNSFSTAMFEATAYSTGIYGATSSVPRDWPPADWPPADERPFLDDVGELVPRGPDKTDEPVTIRIEPAKLRYKRRIE